MCVYKLIWCVYGQTQKEYLNLKGFGRKYEDGSR